jgi:hypothetical protein
MKYGGGGTEGYVKKTNQTIKNNIYITYAPERDREYSTYILEQINNTYRYRGRHGNTNTRNDIHWQAQ